MNTRTIASGAFLLFLALPTSEARAGHKVTWYGDKATAEFEAEDLEHEAPVIVDLNSDPVVAETADGRFIDKRTGRIVTAEDAREAAVRGDLHDTPWDVTTFQRGVEIEVGPGEGNGRYTISKGRHGGVFFDVARHESKADVRLGARSLSGGYEVRNVVAGFHADYDQTLAGSQKGPASAGVTADADAWIGSAREQRVTGTLGAKGVQGNATFERFVGGRLEGEVTGIFVLCGVSMGPTGTGAASYGAGVAGSAYARLDFPSMKLKVGSKLGITAGLGGTLGCSVEISLAKLMKDPRASADCFLEPGRRTIAVLQRGYELARAAGVSVDRTLRLIETLRPGRIPLVGSNVYRAAVTRPLGEPSGTAKKTLTGGAGLAR